MEITGKVEFKGEETSVNATLTKRELVIATDEQYSQSILINFMQGKCNNEIDYLQIGQQVKVGINLKGRSWINPQGEKKYFNDIQGWKVENQSINSQPQNQSQPYNSFVDTSKTVEKQFGKPLPTEGNDDLPF